MELSPPYIHNVNGYIKYGDIEGLKRTTQDLSCISNRKLDILRKPLLFNILATANVHTRFLHHSNNSVFIWNWLRCDCNIRIQKRKTLPRNIFSSHLLSTTTIPILTASYTKPYCLFELRGIISNSPLSLYIPFLTCSTRRALHRLATPFVEKTWLQDLQICRLIIIYFKYYLWV